MDHRAGGDAPPWDVADLETVWRALTVDSGSVVMVITDELRVCFANAAAAALIGRAPEEIEGTSVVTLFPPEAAAGWARAVGEVRHTGRALVRFEWMTGVLCRTTVRPMAGGDAAPGALCVCQLNPTDRPAEGVARRPGRGESADWPEPLGRLTAREIDVLAMIGAGMRNYEIAARLDRSPRTVDGHCGAILRKLGARSRTQLAAAAIRAGLVSPMGEVMITRSDVEGPAPAPETNARAAGSCEPEAAG
ncbi:MAG: response regulator transcription factor [Phycisphaerae bacterium]|nr:response regulator transcription factor [Phycisphaerae bacterium]